MRKIIVLSFITLDGVMQAPGGQEEDFKYGGWSAPYFYEADEAAAGFVEKHMKPADLLLGRKTFEIFASFFPEHPELWPAANDATKYVMSNSITMSDPIAMKWKNTVVINSLADIIHLKNSNDKSGVDIQVHGSGELIQALLKNDLVDELWLKIFPVTLGTGKRLFAEGTTAAAFTLADSFVTPNAVIFVNYKRAGAVKTGAIGV
jgi:dihydrofolate reductase